MALSQILTIKKTAKAVSTISQEDAFLKATSESEKLAQEELEQQAKTLQQSVDVASEKEIIIKLDSSILDEYIEDKDLINEDSLCVTE
jgi:hypothetical protein